MSGNAKSLDEIQYLNLSSQNLTDEMLADAEKLFEDMTSLDELHLGGNLLRKMPKLHLADCRVLNLRNRSNFVIKISEDI